MNVKHLEDYKKLLLAIYKDTSIVKIGTLGGKISGAGRIIKANKKVEILKQFKTIFENKYNLQLTARAFEYISIDLFGKKLTQSWLKKNGLLHSGTSFTKELKSQKEQYEKFKEDLIITNFKEDFINLEINMKELLKEGDPIFSPHKEIQEEIVKANEEEAKKERDRLKNIEIKKNNEASEVVKGLNDDQNIIY